MKNKNLTPMFSLIFGLLFGGLLSALAEAGTLPEHAECDIDFKYNTVTCTNGNGDRWTCRPRDGGWLCNSRLASWTTDCPSCNGPTAPTDPGTLR